MDDIKLKCSHEPQNTEDWVGLWRDGNGVWYLPASFVGQAINSGRWSVAMLVSFGRYIVAHEGQPPEQIPVLEARPPNEFVQVAEIAGHGYPINLYMPDFWQRVRSGETLQEVVKNCLQEIAVENVSHIGETFKDVWRIRMNWRQKWATA